MTYIELQLSSFREYARTMLGEQVEELAMYERNHLLSGKLDRIKMFNIHQDVLKRALGSRVSSILEAALTESPEGHAALTDLLHQAESDCINELLCSSFIRQ